MRTANSSGLLLLVFCICSCFPALPSGSIELDEIKMPAGFKIDLYAGNVPGARSMALGKSGVLFVGTRTTGRVYAILDHNDDHRADEVVTLAEGLNMPNGVAYRDGSLYVAEVSRILCYDDIENHLKDPPQPKVVNDSFPTETHHGWK